MKMYSRSIARILGIERKFRHEVEDAIYYDNLFLEIISSVKNIKQKIKKIQFIEDCISNNFTTKCANEIRELLVNFNLLKTEDIFHEDPFTDTDFKMISETYETYRKYCIYIMNNKKVTFSPLLNFISRLLIEIFKLENSENEHPLYIDPGFGHVFSELKFINKLRWISNNEILVNHLIILKEKGVISYDHVQNVLNLKKRPSINTKESYVEIICLFKFWEINNYIKKASWQWKRIKDTFTDHGKEYNINQLKTQGNSLKDMGFFNEYKAERMHPRIEFFEKILKKI